MIVCVIAESVAVGNDLFYQVWVLLGPFTGGEHGDMEIIIFENLQDGGSLSSRSAAVESDGDLFFGGITDIYFFIHR